VTTERRPRGESTRDLPLEFLPKEPGEFEFACRMRMFRGKVVVE
jgi:plastocyanin domain-containing protein